MAWQIRWFMNWQEIKHEFKFNKKKQKKDSMTYDK